MGQNTSTNNESLQDRFTKLEIAFTTMERDLSVARDSNKKLQKRVNELEEEAIALWYEIVNDNAVCLRTPANA